jgi:SRSO17 transposase
MDFRKIAEKFKDFCNEFRDIFLCHRHDNASAAHQYVCGLVQADKANMERMEERVADSNYEALQQFISDSPWSARAVFDRVSLEADKLLGGTGETALIIDESAFAKKGKSSVGVARQWNGRLGKKENSQVAVFGALAAENRATLVDAELFLPKEWTEDADRCKKSGVPKSARLHRTKPELGLEIVRRQRRLGIRFDYVGGDALYGHGAEFSRAIEDMGEVFLLHVHADQHVFLEDPRPRVPPRRSSRGRAPSRLRPQCQSVRVDDYVKGLGPEDWERVVVRKTTKGPLEVDVHRRRVWTWDGKESRARQRQLVVRRNPSPSGDVKYALTNASPETSTKGLARMEARRFWIERALEDGKSEAGMAEYQVRGWRAWRHHMALVLMAMLFMLRCRIKWAESVPLLSCRDVRLLLSHFLPRADFGADDVIAQMKRRHRKRRAAMENQNSPPADI